MEKLIRMSAKNLYLLTAISSFTFVGVWIYRRAIKPILIQKEVVRLINNLGKNNEPFKES
jgi:hypothetical protein